MELIFKDLSTWLQGALIILICFHTSSYFFTKDKSFILYAGYLFLVFVYLIPKTSSYLSEYLVTQFEFFFYSSNWIIQIAYWMLYSWFTVHFLNIKKKDIKLAKRIKIFIISTLILSIGFFIIDGYYFDFTKMWQFFVFIYTPLSLIIASFFLYTIYRFNDKLNKFFVLGFIFFLGFSVYSLLASIDERLNILAYASPISYFMIGIFLEALVISIGLGYKYHIFRQQRDAFNLKLIAQFKETEKLNIKLQQKLTLEAEKAKLAEVNALYEKEINALKLTTLMNQMNPHFIFNALNSIKLYIINKDEKKATYYLVKFSKLIRVILEASGKSEVSLQQELETMDLYMSIENIRFDNEIDFKINVPKTISLENIKVPPLLLQPFLENAIWHGVSTKKTDKKISISIAKPSNDFIEINITDNGIGREASAKIKAQKSIQRKSFGIDLTKERLKDFTVKFKNNYQLFYEDILSYEKKVIGTKVVLQIPLR